MTSVRMKALGAVLVVLAAWSTCAQTTPEWPTYRADEQGCSEDSAWSGLNLGTLDPEPRLVCLVLLQRCHGRQGQHASVHRTLLRSVHRTASAHPGAQPSINHAAALEACSPSACQAQDAASGCYGFAIGR